MLGKPVPDIAERIDMARQIDAVAQGARGFGASGDDGKVENGKRDHGRKLVCGVEATKAPIRQIRAAQDGVDRQALSGTKYDIFLNDTHCPPSTLASKE